MPFGISPLIHTLLYGQLFLLIATRLGRLIRPFEACHVTTEVIDIFLGW